MHMLWLLGCTSNLTLYSSFLFCLSEATLKALREKPKEAGVPVSEPEPTTEVLFLCSYEGCGKTFIDAGALRKHSHIHGERQYVCHYEGCGKVSFCCLCIETALNAWLFHCIDSTIILLILLSLYFPPDSGRVWLGEEVMGIWNSFFFAIILPSFM